MRSIVCLAAEGVIRDAQTNNISIFNILEGVTAEGFPLFIQRVTFFVFWERDAEDPQQISGRFRVEVAGRELHAQPIHINFGNVLKNRTIIVTQGLVIPQPGSLTFAITLDSGLTASYTVPANAVASAVQADTTSSPNT